MTPKLWGRSTPLWMNAIQWLLTFAVYAGWVHLDGAGVGILLSAMSSLLALAVGVALTPNGEVNKVIEAGTAAVAAKNTELSVTKSLATAPPAPSQEVVG